MTTSQPAPGLRRPSQSPPTRPRVLHVLKGLPRGGIETWLMHVLRHRHLSSCDHEILVMLREPGAYEPEAEALGVKIHKVPQDGSWLNWIVRLHHFLKDEGPFDIVHSHLGYLVSGLVLAAAKRAGVRARIAHQHDARSLGPDVNGVKHRVRKAVGMFLSQRYATRRLGISEATIEELAGKSWLTDPTCSILLYGFDYSSFEGASERATVLRRKLGLAPHRKIVGHVGRFDPVKNHDFLLRAFSHAASHRDLVLVLIGRGRLRPDIEALAGELGISEKVLFAGATDDVPGFMAMFDIFVFPSFSEGLGIVCLEAQAAGTPSLVSDTVPAEVSVVPGGIEYQSLAAGSQAWGERMIALVDHPAPDSADWRRQVAESQFGIRRCIKDLDEIYRAEVERTA